MSGRAPDLAVSVWLFQSGWRPWASWPDGTGLRMWAPCSAAGRNQGGGWYLWAGDEASSTDLTQPAGSRRNNACGPWPCVGQLSSASSPKARAELFNRDVIPHSSCCLGYKQLGDSRGKESSLPSKAVTKDFHLAEGSSKPGRPPLSLPAACRLPFSSGRI